MIGLKTIIITVILSFIISFSVNADTYDFSIIESQSLVNTEQTNLTVTIDIKDVTVNTEIYVVFNLGLSSQKVLKTLLIQGKATISENINTSIVQDFSSVSLAIDDKIYLYKKPYSILINSTQIIDEPIGDYVGGVFSLSAETAHTVAEVSTPKVIRSTSSTILLDKTNRLLSVKVISFVAILSLICYKIIRSIKTFRN